MELLKTYVDVVLLRDVLERHNVSQPQVLRWLVQQLLGNAAGAFGINQFFNDLKSRGVAVGKERLHEYLYVRTASGYEVDFLMTHYDRSQTLIQVCVDNNDAQTLEREVRALQEAQLEFPKAQCLLITLEQPVRWPAIKGIEVAQAVDWLLPSAKNADSNT